MPLNAFGLQGKGRAAGIYPKSVLRSPQKCVSHPPPVLVWATRQLAL